MRESFPAQLPTNAAGLVVHALVLEGRKDRPTTRGKMRDADIGCKVATRAFQHRLVLFAMLMASRLHFFRLSATLTHGRKVMAEGTFCHESGDRRPGS